MEKRIRASMVCLHQNSILVFKGVDPLSGKQYWFLPGGSIEKDEKPWACAERETFEETGYHVRALPNSELQKNYYFHWNGIDYDCLTYFYRGELSQEFAPPSTVVDASYNLGAQWIPLAEAIESFAYTKEIQDAVVQLSKSIEK